MKREKSIQIDREFMNLTIFATQKEQEKLESSLLRHGCQQPIILWDGLVLDGHKRLAICEYEEIEYQAETLEFPSREEAIMWVCRKRLSEVKHGTTYYWYLIGKIYNCQKKAKKERQTQRREAKGKTAGDDACVIPIRSCKTLSVELGICQTTVAQYGRFAESMDNIAKMEPLLFQAIMMGTMNCSMNEVIRLKKADARKLSDLRKKWAKSSHEKAGERDSKQGNLKQNNGERKNGQDSDNEAPLVVGIKEMPAFDPDMELNGLTLTVPMWMNTIARTEMNTDMQLATERAKKQLSITLKRLEEQIQKTLEALR